MFFFHCLRQELDNSWMKIVTDQYLARGSEKRHVIGWIGRINFNHALWNTSRTRSGKMRVKASAIGKSISRTLGFVSKA